MLDPVTLQVIGHGLQSISDEMVATMVRTSYSTNIKDRRDCSAGVFLPDGAVVNQSAVGTPLHLGVMPFSVSTAIARIPVADLEPGDDIVLNTPYPAGPGHLNDVTIVSPVFHGGRVVALVANASHHVDVGGGAPGSMPFGVTEIYQEGLQIPPVKIVRRNAVDTALLELIQSNVRTTHEFKGDLLAQVAAANVGESRLQEVLDEYGVDEWQAYVAELVDYSERRTRAAIAALPDGEWEFEDVIEGDGVRDGLIRIHARVTVAGECIRVDFTGSSDQVLGPINCRRPSVVACVYYAVKCICDPGLPPNAGTYRPITVVTRPGSILEADFPSAVCNANIITTQRIVDVLLGCLGQAVPDRVTAACSGTMNLLNIGGRHPRTGALFNYIETYGGGQGASIGRDGMSGVHTHMTNTRNASVEQIEIAYPLTVERYGLVEDSEGPGRWRGGFGIVREIRIDSLQTTVTLSSDRHRVAPWGCAGGHAAQCGRCLLIHPDGTTEWLPSKVTRAVPTGARLVSITPGGGGWGDPREREERALEEDVSDGLISAPRAAAEYVSGVARAEPLSSQLTEVDR